MQGLDAKRMAFLTGHAASPSAFEHKKTAEELLAEELAAKAAGQRSALT
jgi:hypothetical protein